MIVWQKEKKERESCAFMLFLSANIKKFLFSYNKDIWQVSVFYFIWRSARYTRWNPMERQIYGLPSDNYTE